MSTEYLKRLASPLGRIEITANRAAITSLSIETAGSLPHDDEDERPSELLERAAEQLAEYFEGSRTSFDLPVALSGTLFQMAIWHELSLIEWGTVRSYGELGRATGRATAGRAVGGAVGANPVPLIVPCHRVLGSNGTITGYSAGDGISTKFWLLRHENIPHATGPSAEARDAAILVGR